MTGDPGWQDLLAAAVGSVVCMLTTCFDLSIVQPLGGVKRK